MYGSEPTKHKQKCDKPSRRATRPPNPLPELCFSMMRPRCAFPKEAICFFCSRLLYHRNKQGGKKAPEWAFSWSGLLQVVNIRRSASLCFALVSRTVGGWAHETTFKTRVYLPLHTTYLACWICFYLPVRSSIVQPISAENRSSRRPSLTRCSESSFFLRGPGCTYSSLECLPLPSGFITSD